VSKKTIKCN